MAPRGPIDRTRPNTHFAYSPLRWIKHGDTCDVPINVGGGQISVRVIFKILHIYFWFIDNCIIIYTILHLIIYSLNIVRKLEKKKPFINILPMWRRLGSAQSTTLTSLVWGAQSLATGNKGGFPSIPERVLLYTLVSFVLPLSSCNWGRRFVRD